MESAVRIEKAGCAAGQQHLTAHGNLAECDPVTSAFENIYGHFISLDAYRSVGSLERSEKISKSCCAFNGILLETTDFLLCLVFYSTHALGPLSWCFHKG
jgi:hypothetical protein